MTRSVQLTILVSYKAASVDPAEVAMQLARQVEVKLKEVLPAVGTAFGNLIDNSANLPWLDPEE